MATVDVTGANGKRDIDWLKLLVQMPGGTFLLFLGWRLRLSR